MLRERLDAVSVPFTPLNKVELVACFHEIDRGLPVTVRPAAAELLKPWELRTVGDVLDLKQAWPYGRLRIKIERRQPLVEVVIEPANSGSSA